MQTKHLANAIILHGRPGKKEYYSADFPSASNAHWLPWLQKQLFMRDIPAQTPEVPNAYRRNYLTWRKEFERYDITPETIIIGHSLGGGFCALVERTQKPKSRQSCAGCAAA